MDSMGKGRFLIGISLGRKKQEQIRGHFWIFGGVDPLDFHDDAVDGSEIRLTS